MRQPYVRADYPQVSFIPNPPPLEFTITYLNQPGEPMSTDNQIQHREQLHGKLKPLFGNLARFISDRDAHYESSWKKRGGPGAFNTIARPWDRFEAIAKRNGQDIFSVIQMEIDQGKTENDDGTLQACVRDLLCYMALLMVETADMRKVYKDPMQAIFTDGGEAIGIKRHYHGTDEGNTASPPSKEEAPNRKHWKQRIQDCCLNFKLLGDYNQASPEYLYMAIDNLLEILLTIETK